MVGTLNTPKGICLFFFFFFFHCLFSYKKYFDTHKVRCISFSFLSHLGSTSDDFLWLPSGNMKSKWGRSDVAATSSRRIDVSPTLFWRHVPADFGLHRSFNLVAAPFLMILFTVLPYWWLRRLVCRPIAYMFPNVIRCQCKVASKNILFPEELILLWQKPLVYTLLIVVSCIAICYASYFLWHIIENRYNIFCAFYFFEMCSIVVSVSWNLNVYFYL